MEMVRWSSLTADSTTTGWWVSSACATCALCFCAEWTPKFIPSKAGKLDESSLVFSDPQIQMDGKCHRFQQISSTSPIFAIRIPYNIHQPTGVEDGWKLDWDGPKILVPVVSWMAPFPRSLTTCNFCRWCHTNLERRKGHETRVGFAVQKCEINSILIILKTIDHFRQFSSHQRPMTDQAACFARRVSAPGSHGPSRALWWFNNPIKICTVCHAYTNAHITCVYKQINEQMNK